MSQRVGGIIQFQAGGVLLAAKGNFSWNTGKPKRDAVLGADRVHGYKEGIQTPFIEGAITIDEDTDVDAITTLKDATAFLQLPNGAAVILKDSWFAGEGTGTTEEGELPVRFEAKTGEYVPA